jgi:iron complex outermembrane receptor protein
VSVPPSVQTYIRGVGNTGTDANAESAIAYSINGVYNSRPNGIGPIFLDLDRVEVLKGPQGTLYGRNASGGAINLITRQPTLGKYGGNVEAEGRSACATCASSLLRKRTRSRNTFCIGV